MSQRDSGYARKERDFYETPPWVTQAVWPAHVFGKYVWEPAAGNCAMARVLANAASEVCVTDIEPIDMCDSFLTQLDAGDFFSWLAMPEAQRGQIDTIITNPPYEQATEFIEHALKLSESVQGKVAMLLRTDFDHAKSRSHLFRDCSAFAKKLVLTKRIVWFEPEAGAKGKSPSFNHAWFIWNWQHEGPPVLAYGP